MFRHTVLFTWTDDVDDEQVDEIGAALDGLAATVPGIVDYRHGRDAGVNEGNADYVIVADFASTDDYLVYRDHPDHKRFIAEHLSGRLASRAVAQYDAG